MRISDWSSDVCSSDLLVGDLPVVLDIDAELLVLRLDERRAVGKRGRELDLVGLLEALVHVVVVLRVRRVPLERAELDAFVLQTHLQPVPFPAQEGQVVLPPPALLALVLEGRPAPAREPAPPGGGRGGGVAARVPAGRARPGLKS